MAREEQPPCLIRFSVTMWSGSALGEELRLPACEFSGDRSFVLWFCAAFVASRSFTLLSLISGTGPETRETFMVASDLTGLQL